MFGRDTLSPLYVAPVSVDVVLNYPQLPSYCKEVHDRRITHQPRATLITHSRTLNGLILGTPVPCMAVFRPTTRFVSLPDGEPGRSVSRGARASASVRKTLDVRFEPVSSTKSPTQCMWRCYLLSCGGQQSIDYPSQDNLHNTSPKISTKHTAICHPLPLVMVVSLTPHMLHSSRCRGG